MYNNSFIFVAYRDSSPGVKGISIIDFKEALIKSLSAFILEFLCNARNGTTRIASYLRSPMTKQCIKILIKADSMN